MKENVLQTFRCLSDELTGKFVSIHVPNKYEDIILCELEVYQVETDELQGTLIISSIFTFKSTFEMIEKKTTPLLLHHHQAYLVVHSH